MSNCGLEALSRMTAIENVSMFSLIHLARDNGINLYFCKVEPDELMDVVRPAIFHQENHFVFVKNGDPMPEGQYTGYVLTPKARNEPLPFTLAKKVKGAKKSGGFASFLQPIAIGLASIVNPVLGAAVGAGFGAAKAAGAFGDQGKGEWWRIATGGLSGALGGKMPGISALSAAAGEIPGAVKSGNWMAPIGAGLGQYGANIAAGGFGQGFSQAGQQGAGLLGKIQGGIQGGVQSLGNKISQFTGGTPGSGGIQTAGSTTPAGYGGTYTIPGIGSKIVGLPGGGGPAGFSFGAGGAQAAAQGITAGGGGKNALSWLGTAASTLLKPPQLEGNAQDNYAKSAQFLGNENYKALPTATRKQLEEYVNTPLDELSKKFIAQDDKGLRMLEEKHQQEKSALISQYANYGQDPYTSSDAQQKLTEIDRQYDQAKSEYQQQIQNQAMQQAIEFKQETLRKSMEQGNFDYNAAMELASAVGKDQDLKYAMESKNHEALQNVLAELFSIGTQPQYSYDQQRGYMQR